MTLNEIDLRRTGILFFDLLNAYYHGADEAARARKRPMVENAARLMRAAREVKMPIFFAKGNHRADGATSSPLMTDTDTNLKPWPQERIARRKPKSVEGEWGS